MTTQSVKGSLGREDRATLVRILRVLEQFRGLDSEMQMPQAVTLLTIALNEGLSLTELTEKTYQATSSASRNVAALASVHRIGRPGHGLVLNMEDPVERRKKRHVLTPKGRAFIQRLLDSVNG